MLSIAQVLYNPDMKKHLAIFKFDLAEKILTGEKTIESRFSKTRLSPFAEVSCGDIVYIKPSGKDIIGQFEVEKVIFYEGLDKADIEKIKQDYGEQIAPGSKYASLIFIGQTTRFLVSPIKIEKKDQRGWVVLG